MLVTDGLRRPDPGVISRDERVRAFERLYLPVNSTLSRATIIKVGQLVGAAEVVMGAFRVEGTTLSVTARSIRLDAGRLQPEVTESGQLTDLFAIFDRLAARVAKRTPPSPPAVRPPLGAFENYIKGLVAESPVAQAEFLESALRDQPGIRPGAAGVVGRPHRGSRSCRRARSGAGRCRRRRRAASAPASPPRSR